MAITAEAEGFRTENDLLERVLSVDFYRDLPKDIPNQLPDVQSSIRWDTPLEPLPIQFENVETYQRSFFPLYMIECLQMLASSKYMSMAYPLRVSEVGCNKSGRFVEITLKSSAVMPFVCGDIALLYVGQPGHDIVPKNDAETMQVDTLPKDADEGPAYVVVPDDHPLYQDTLKHALGFVLEAKRRICTLQVLAMPPRFCNPKTFDIRSVERLEAIQELILWSRSKSGSKKFSGMGRGDSDKEVWYLSKLCSFTTALREFQALRGLPRMPLQEKLLMGSVEPPQDQPVSDMDKDTYLEGIRIPKMLRKSLEASYNAAQLRAIRNSLNSNGITLIQGPPGTGKTTTIIGIISAILEQDFLPYDSDAKTEPSTETPGTSDASQINKPAWFKYIDGNNMNEPLEIAFDKLSITDTQTTNGTHRYDSYACMKPAKSSSSEKVRVPTLRHSRRRILICAPSNAAIDEIVRRLVRPHTGGIFDADGNRLNPSVTRIGPNFHDDLTVYSLNNKIDMLGRKKYGHKFPQMKNHFRSRLVTETLLQSDIVCSTLSACGSMDMVKNHAMFHTLIIDEATQAVELSTLIALRLGCSRVVLVGDPCQLSATVCSNVAVSLKYDRSLFQRLQMCGYPVNLLDIQYRMDPGISRFPSMYFYKSQLKDAPSVYQRQQRDWREFPLLRPAVFYAIDSMQSKDETSYKNEMEANLVCQLLDMILTVLKAERGYKPELLEQRIAVITTYSAQVALLKETIAMRHPQLVAPPVEKEKKKKVKEPVPPGPQLPKLLIDVSTVDGFQGMEKEIVIFSAVRTGYVGQKNAAQKTLREITPPNVLTIDNEPHDPDAAQQFANQMQEYVDGILTGKTTSTIPDVVDVSFIADRRRINVAITRACRNLFIIGNPRFLLRHTHWQALYHHYAQCGGVFICKPERGKMRENYLQTWGRDYLLRDKQARKRYLKNPLLSKLILKIMGWDAKTADEEITDQQPATAQQANKTPANQQP
ncbi:DNA2/NAM7 HELICASE FAMILY protein, putative [Babesia bigemina]|uniref:DNA2/NAM7 HELICASE FAMILY protein, putative n=1 Tax=Babesia bigemina TaxID=5866 RepID=A0A061D805_BABBI|nr:DNA2/NAM7 HELICASE FAMILY protein, putative [Babesia bigemina]CDR96678.1 DNA2/NAM7 HELICASE FAMILY protein, putative [Babesia bigemina]|eukprot:XP_012768864.1 DNA2/NAM7 HELICASE FAMILY protein, putative [Babesia bigemina]